MANLRNNTRFNVNLFVHNIFNEKDRILFRSLNLSNDGICLVGADNHVILDDGRYVWLHFWVPDSDELLKVLAKVVYNKDDGKTKICGLKFKHVFPRYKRILDKYLNGRHKVALDFDV